MDLRRVATRVLVGLGLLGSTLVVARVLTGYAAGNYPFMYDARAYWSVSGASPYHGTELGQPGAYWYSPAFLQVLAPLRALSWPAFAATWLAINGATLVWLGGRRVLYLLAFPPVVFELLEGNVHLLMAAALVLGFRFAGSWAFLVLTKVSPGVCLAWFAARHEWRQLALALGLSAGVALVSFAFAPSLWFDWVRTVLAARPRADWTSLGMPVRVVGGGVLAWWGGRTSRPWVLPFAVIFSLPSLWFSGLAILAALPALSGVRMQPIGAGEVSPAPELARAESPAFAARSDAEDDRSVRHAPVSGREG